MASAELKNFLAGVNSTYVQYADQLHAASIYNVAELAAARVEDVVKVVPLGAAGVMINAAGAIWGNEAQITIPGISTSQSMSRTAPKRYFLIQHLIL
jgi:hypothetical protein